MQHCTVIGIIIGVVGTAAVLGGIAAAVYFTWPKQTVCDKFQYRCNNGPCISNSSVCDGVKDCPSGDDESSLQCNCSEFQYSCKNGPCISKSSVCDGVKDCPLGDDETPPQCSQCTADQFLCVNSQLCISSNKQCNGISDCVDSSDESNCSQTFLVGNFNVVMDNSTNPTESSICSYLKSILNNAQVTTINCTAMTTRSGTISVKVGYKVGIEYPGKTSEFTILTTASSALALVSSDTSVFLIDQSSVEFEDKNGVVQRFCNSSTICSSNNTVCISVIGDHVCACKNGFTRSGNSGNCGFAAQSRYCRPTGTWISSYRICDQYQDCPDDSDEINCVCSQYQYSCNNGRCISKTWLCDGVKDCPLGDDESSPQCSQCTEDEFLCGKPHKCIPSNQQCNGISDCLDSSDESHCLSFSTTGPTTGGVVTQVVTAIYEGVSGYYICSDNWNTMWSDLVCKEMGYNNSVATSLVSVNGSLFLTVDPLTTSSYILALLRPSNCSSGSAISISCQAMDCGRRAVSSDSVGPYILDGQRAARGAWPWQVAVITSVEGQSSFLLCGGVLLNDRWVLTAAHCTIADEALLGYTGTTKPEDIQIQLGSIELFGGPDLISSAVDQVHTHPQYNATEINNDVGLIRLSKPVKFTETVRPICLPAPDEDLNRFRVCVDTGFGKTLRNVISYDLLQAKMDIIPYDSCLENNRYLLNDTQICIAMIPTTGSTGICLGDSGGPLSCEDENGIWTVIGINSYVVGSGGRNAPASDVCRLSVVARVSAFISWIEDTMSMNSS